ncbi:MAG: UDP binding domain-containing protein, partial [Flavobacteriales bacterium]
YHPEIILAGRRLNDSMGTYVVSEIVKTMLNKQAGIKGSKALLLGITFKENCPDIRNTKAIDIYRELKAFHMDVDLYDPWASAEEVKSTYNIDCLTETPSENYDLIVHAVAHNEFKTLDLSTLSHEKTTIYDVKGSLDSKLVDKRL